MRFLPLTELRAAAGKLKTHLQEADRNRDTKLTGSEVRRHGHALDDGFTAGGAMLSVLGWAARGIANKSQAPLAAVLSKVDAAVHAAARKDVDQNGVIDAGPEFTSANRLKTFQGLYDLAEMPVFQSGEALYALMQRADVSAKRRYHSPADVPASLRDAVIAATNESTYVATNLEEAFAQVDQNEFVVRYLKDPAIDRSLIVIDYGAGDSTYGAIFDRETKKQLAGIQDGEIVPK